MDMLSEELNQLLSPRWGSEKWILEGWKKLNREEKQKITQRLYQLFQHGLPFKPSHELLLYIYLFSLMTQQAVLGIQLPLRFEESINNPELRKKIRTQLLDEVYHAIVFTRIAFTLSAPHQFPPAYDEHIEKICEFIRSIECPKVFAVLMNFVFKGLIEEVFSALKENLIAKEIFEFMLEDKQNHLTEAELYQEIGLPDQEILKDKLNRLEDLVISSFTLQPVYGATLSALLEPEPMLQLLQALHDKHALQLKKFNLTPGEKLELAFQVAFEIQKEYQMNEVPFNQFKEQIKHEAQQEIFEVETTTHQRLLISQFKSPSDPTMTFQFDLDITEFGFFEDEQAPELLKILMMQTVSHFLTTHDSFRYFLKFKKTHCSQGAYLAIAEKLPDCDEYISAICFRNCHELEALDLSKRIAEAKERMTYCYKKRAEIDSEYPEIKEALNLWLATYPNEIYPFPTPGSNITFLYDLNAYGYTRANAPLSQHLGPQILLLSVEKKQVWNNQSKSFETKDLLPISISADSRVFEKLLPIPQLIYESFQFMLKKLNLPREPRNSKEDALISQICDSLIRQKNIASHRKVLSYLMNRKIVLKESQRLFKEDIEIYGKTLSQWSNFDNIANQLLFDYLGFNAEAARKNEQFTNLIERMLNENRELGYKILLGLQTLWFDYLDIEKSFNTIYHKISNHRLFKLAKLLPGAVN